MSHNQVALAEQTRTLDEMMSHARSLVPQLKERQRRTDELRRLPQETVDDLKENGVLGIMVPEALGGSDLGATALLDVCMELARGSASAAWVAGNWAVHGLLGAMFPEQTSTELFKTGLPTIATGFSPLRASTELVDGGAVVTGQWDFCSGINYSDWIVVQAMTAEGPVAHLIPTSELTVLDNWDTSGLRGSGSHDVKAEAVFVPEHHLLRMASASDGNSPGAELFETTSLRLPLTSLFGTGVMAVVLGSASAAIDAFVGKTAGTVGGLTGVKRSSRPEVHLVLGKAAADVEGAVALLKATFKEGEDAVASGVPASMRDRVRWRRNGAWSGQVAAGVLNDIYEIAGARSLFRGDPLDQAFRDGIAASHHVHLAWDRLYVGYGELMMGADETDLIMV